MLDLHYTNKDLQKVVRTVVSFTWNFNVIETSLQGLLPFRPGSSVHEWLTNIINKLFDITMFFISACGFACVWQTYIFWGVFNLPVLAVIFYIYGDKKKKSKALQYFVWIWLLYFEVYLYNCLGKGQPKKFDTSRCLRFFYK